MISIQKNGTKSYEMDEANPSIKIPKIYKLEDENYNGIVDNENEISDKISLAIQKSREWGKRIPIGVFYQNDKVITYGERIENRIENYLSSPPATQIINDKDGNTIANIDNHLEKLKTN